MNLTGSGLVILYRLLLLMATADSCFPYYDLSSLSTPSFVITGSSRQVCCFYFELPC